MIRFFQRIGQGVLRFFLSLLAPFCGVLYVTSARSGFGALWQKGDGASPEVFSTIAEIRRIRFTGFNHPTILVTNNDSPNAAAEKIKRGFTDYGQVEIEGNLTGGATHQALYGTSLTGVTAINYKMTWPGITAWGPFSCHQTDAGPYEAPHDADMTFQAKYEITGKPTLP